MVLNRFVLAVICAMVAAIARAEEPATQDLEKLQGAWRLDKEGTLFFWTGWIAEQQFPNFHDFESGEAIEIERDKLRYGHNLAREISITLGTAEGKKTISFTSGDNPPIVGIYELEEGEFRICAVDPRFGQKDDVPDRPLPEKCARTRLGWFAQFKRSPP